LKLKITYVPTESLIPYARNAKVHPPEQISQIAGSLKEFGFINPVIVDKGNAIIAGHGRVLAAQKIGLTEVPTLSAEHLTTAQVKAFRLADNRIAQNGSWDDELLKIELQELDDLGIDLLTLGFDEDDLPKDEGNPGNGDPDDVPETPKDVWVKPGDMFELGNHRLLCGDSTKREDVDRLMNGEKADMVFTDPPYGVAYKGKTKDALEIESDDVSPEKLAAMNEQWFDRVDEVAKEGAYLLATVPARPWHFIFAGDWQRRGWLRQIMVWNKSAMVLGHSEYHYKHEPILFGWKPGGSRLKNADRTKTTVWDFDKPSANREHPTMKPVDMWCYGVSNHTKSGDLLYEPFGGSGTTTIACEKTGRRCFSMEIDPQYVQVILERWAKFSGKQWAKLDT
jgi:DNA modification methylase